jgi:acyl-coenzyme A thioesterase 9
MHDSYCELVLPFKTSPEFLEQYTNASGGIRTGKIMELLDSTAGSVAYKHILGPEVETVGTIQEQGFYVVTASVDRYEREPGGEVSYLTRHVLQGWTRWLRYIRH